MRIEIDFDNKTIEVKDSTTLGELVDKLKELKLDWKEFKLKVGVEYIPYPWYIPQTLPYNPWYSPTYCGDNKGTGTPPPELPYTTCGTVTMQNLGLQRVDWNYTD